MSPAILISILSTALACPFCNVVQPSLAERRDAAEIVLLVEVVSQTGRNLVAIKQQMLKAHGTPDNERSFVVDADTPLTKGQLVLLFSEPTTPAADDGTSPPKSWSVVPVDETSALYVARAPSTRLPAAERLAYFAPYLEHANPTIADDAYAEFGRAPLDAVRKVANRLSMPSIREWLVDETVPQSRKGLYGMLLGLASTADDRKNNAEVLESVIAAPSSGFRSGFDGILAGYLLLEGERGLKELDRRYVNDTKARRGDVLHFLSAVRFYSEFGNGISQSRLAQAIRPLVERPEFAAAVIIDLARWQTWEAATQIASLFDRAEFDDLAIERAIVGFLVVCPTTDAKAALDALRTRHPERIADLERTALLFTFGR
ncbi:MAG TPA: hypothetical protein VHV77_01565 [Pirellulales bacterium]|jgi:hypothetical protein|nr:hypothetical protein [Pirellulales bacterium]